MVNTMVWVYLNIDSMKSRLDTHYHIYAHNKYIDFDPNEHWAAIAISHERRTINLLHINWTTVLNSVLSALVNRRLLCCQRWNMCCPFFIWCTNIIIENCSHSVGILSSTIILHATTSTCLNRTLCWSLHCSQNAASLFDFCTHCGVLCKMACFKYPNETNIINKVIGTQSY